MVLEVANEEDEEELLNTWNKIFSREVLFPGSPSYVNQLGCSEYLGSAVSF